MLKVVIPNVTPYLMTDIVEELREKKHFPCLERRRASREKPRSPSARQPFDDLAGQRKRAHDDVQRSGDGVRLGGDRDHELRKVLQKHIGEQLHNRTQVGKRITGWHAEM